MTSIAHLNTVDREQELNQRYSRDQHVHSIVSVQRCVLIYLAGLPVKPTNHHHYRLCVIFRLSQSRISWIREGTVKLKLSTWKSSYQPRFFVVCQCTDTCYHRFYALKAYDAATWQLKRRKYKFRCDVWTMKFQLLIEVHTEDEEAPKNGRNIFHVLLLHCCHKHAVKKLKFPPKS